MSSSDVAEEAEDGHHDVNKIQSSRIVILRDGLEESSTNSIISLIHPGYGKRTMFYLGGGSGDEPRKLYEIQRVDEEFRCWMVNRSLRTDNQMYLITPMDPLFILLPHLKRQCSTRAVPIEHVLASAGDPNLTDIRETVRNVDLIADPAGPAHLSAYKYSEEKTMRWLEEKVERVTRALRSNKIYAKAGAACAAFVPSSREGDSDRDSASLARYAFGIVSEYLGDDVRDALLLRLGLAEADPKTAKRKDGDPEGAFAPKRVRTEDMDSFQEAHSHIIAPAPPRPSAPPAPSAKSKLDRRAAAGSKNIMSFFKK